MVTMRILLWRSFVGFMEESLDLVNWVEFLSSESEVQ